MTVFVDAETLCALLEREHPYHRLAASLWQIEVEGRSSLATSNYAALKACGDLSARHGVAGVRTLVEELLPLLHIEWVSPEDHRLGLAACLARAASSGESADLVKHVDDVIVGRLTNGERFCL